jgi:DNA replication protein DnaC
MFTTHTQLIDQIKRTFKGKDDNPLDHWLANTDLLLFDEFGGIGGGANMTEWFKATTIDIIQRIYERWAAGKLSIVMTTNLTPEELFNKALNRNKAGASRLQAIFKKPIKMQGRDRRGDNGDLSAWGVK